MTIHKPAPVAPPPGDQLVILEHGAPGQPPRLRVTHPDPATGPVDSTLVSALTPWAILLRRNARRIAGALAALVVLLAIVLKVVG